MGKTIEERLENIEKQIESIKKEISGRKFYGKSVGDTFELIGVQWKILDITKEGYSCLAMSAAIKNEEFDNEQNNWAESSLRKKLHNQILPKIKNEIGDDAVVKFKRDLTSMDGLTEYGNYMDEISLISASEYRKYRNLIPNSEKEWWWTITPWSTKGNGVDNYMAVVSPSGLFSFNSCSNSGGVRPFCIFSSILFEL